MNRIALAFSLAFALTPVVALAGIIVGPPIEFRSAPNTMVHMDSAWATVDSVVYKTCNGVPTVIEVDAELDLIHSPLPSPVGTWCSVKVNLDSNLDLYAVGTGRSVAASLPMDELVFWSNGPVVIVENGASAKLEMGFSGYLDIIAPQSGNLVVQSGSQQEIGLVHDINVGSVFIAP